MEEEKTKKVLDFILNSYRAKLALHDISDGCRFDFTSFLTAWKCSSWSQLKITMHKTLEPLMQQGLFDSILPYLASSISQTWMGRDELSLTTITDVTKTNSENSAGIICNIDLTPAVVPSIKKKSEKQRENNEDCEILIHVCDESKGIREDFHCLQSVLVREMGYFSRVTVKGQRLRDMDISVHCDISVFEWLMQWIRFGNGETTLPKQTLEPYNVIGILVSAEFLQMSSLVLECLQYTYDNLGEIINVSPNLGCLNESLTSRLAHYFDSAELERRIQNIDRNDRITSRLYSQFIFILNNTEPDMDRGHYASTVSTFKCDLCGQILINEVASKVACSSMRFDCRGRIYANHIKDPTWSLGSYIKDLKRELKTWRKVYWRLWASVHFFECGRCHMYFPAKNLDGCKFHPSPLQLSVGTRMDRKDRGLGKNVGSKKSHEDFEGSKASGRSLLSEEPSMPSNDIVLPYGYYPCCKPPAYRCNPLSFVNGCESRDHCVDNYCEDNPTLKKMLEFRELVVYSGGHQSTRKEPDWIGIMEMTAEKPLSKPASVNSNSNRSENILTHKDGSSPSLSSDSGASGDEIGHPFDHHNNEANNTYGKLFDSWVWNTELTTRYNQDMQREREEKLMIDLAVLLSKRISLENSSGYLPSKLGYLSRRSAKNVGGSYVKLEQSWRDELSITRFHRNPKTSKAAQSTNGARLSNGEHA